jgi:hypothetical protein
MHAPGLSSRVVSEDENELFRDTRWYRYRNTPLDLSIAKAQNGDVVFEVKYLEYTLFVPILLPPCKLIMAY